MQLEGLALRLVPVKSRSEGGYGVVGNGRVNTEATFNNIMTKWRWGNFDKHDTYVNTSYGPSLQTMRIVFIRTARALLAKGEKEKAVALINKYFEAFPAFNFPHDYFSTYLLDVLVKAEASDKAIPIIREIAKETAQQLAFYDSQTDRDMKVSYQQDFQFAMRTASDIKRLAAETKDAGLIGEVDGLFATWKTLIDQPGSPLQ
jgi:hypothetical protein